MRELLQLAWVHQYLKGALSFAYELFHDVGVCYESAGRVGLSIERKDIQSYVYDPVGIFFLVTVIAVDQVHEYLLGKQVHDCFHILGLHHAGKRVIAALRFSINSCVLSKNRVVFIVVATRTASLPLSYALIQSCLGNQK